MDFSTTKSILKPPKGTNLLFMKKIIFLFILIFSATVCFSQKKNIKINHKIICYIVMDKSSADNIFTVYPVFVNGSLGSPFYGIIHAESRSIQQEATKKLNEWFDEKYLINRCQPGEYHDFSPNPVEYWVGRKPAVKVYGNYCEGKLFEFTYRNRYRKEA